MYSSDKIFQQIVKMVPGIVAVFNVKTGQYLFVNDAVEKILGYPKQEFLDKGHPFVASLIHPDDINIVIKGNSKALEESIKYKNTDRIKDIIVRVEYRMRHRNGTWRWIRTEGVIFSKDKEGNIENAMNISVDITSLKETELKETANRKAFEEALKTSEKKFRTLIQESIDVIQLIDASGKIIYSSDSVEKVVGYKPVEMQENDAALYIHPDDTNRYSKALSYILEKPGNQVTDEYRVKHKNGMWIWIKATVVNRLDDPVIKAVVGNFRNITERKLLEKQKDEFLGVVSHELKTPLTSIKAFAQVIQRRFVSAEDKKSIELLGKMDTQINKLTNLIRDLFDISKVDSGRFKLKKKYFNFDGLLNEIVEEMRMTTQKHKIYIKSTVSKKIYTDRERIGQVLTNLLTNAVKYSPENSNINIGSTVENKLLVTYVEDFGIGIPEDHVKDIFNRFFRVEKKSYNTVPGMGLGLSIASEIIKLHNGNIWAESEYGKGSRFYFTLPLTSGDRKY